MVIKAPLSWLREYCHIPWPVEELTERLTLAGLEIDAVDVIGGEYENMVIGSVVTAERHPNADRLSLCTVDIGSETLEIVCGAPNVAAGQRVPVALVGARLPGGMTIKKARIRGIESNGMICSEAELNLSDEQDGIMILDHDAPVGQPLKTVLGDPETVLSVDVGANRPDCLAITGIAREITAITRGELRMPSGRVQESGPPIDE
jgi:phenylalanyl-tRNA synthetase beta chain